MAPEEKVEMTPLQYTDKYSFFPSKIGEGLIRLPPYDDPACWSIDQAALSLWLRHWMYDMRTITLIGVIIIWFGDTVNELYRTKYISNSKLQVMSA